MNSQHFSLLMNHEPPAKAGIYVGIRRRRDWDSSDVWSIDA
jgi:hypothetical protein